MFYEENKIIEIISCSNCQEKLDESIRMLIVS